MRVLVCPTAFKESLSATRVAEALADGVQGALPEALVERLPVSDGGPGLIEAVSAVSSGEIRTLGISGPLGGEETARCLWLSDHEVVLEVADVCGLHLIPPDRRDPLRASTAGVGEVVRQCLEEGATALRIGLGGSGTVDGGTGMARSLGWRFLDAAGCDLPPGGASLVDLVRVRPPDRPFVGERVAVTAIADVRSPLLGPDGAARRFGPQKGATAIEVELLESGLTRLAERVRKDLGLDVSELSGAGAAGGLGAACVAFLGGEIVEGSRWVLERLEFDAAIRRADLIVTGEGVYDATSELGKIVGEIVRRARDAGKPVLLVCAGLSGPVPRGVTAVEGSGRWLEPADLTRMVAGALA